MKLDYSVESVEDRKTIVNQILNSPDSTYSLDALADYLITAMNKQERKQRYILTANREKTINRREQKFSIETDDDMETLLYHIKPPTANTKLPSRPQITEQDLRLYPELRQIQETALTYKNIYPQLTEYQAYLAKKISIELYQDLYLAKDLLRQPVTVSMRHNEVHHPSLDFISLTDSRTVKAILSNYSKLKEDSFDCPDSDIALLLLDFDDLSYKATQNHPHLRFLLINKIDGKSNAYIAKEMRFQLGLTYNENYISTLWTTKLPNLIAETAQQQLRKPNPHEKTKQCGSCLQYLTLDSKNFHKNKFSSDGFYSLCKQCRAARRKKSKS